MSDLFPVKVECYSGFKADEYPRYFYLGHIRLEVEEIIDRWYQLNASHELGNFDLIFPAADYYKVRTTTQRIYFLKHETETDNWFLWIKNESINLH